MCTRLSLVVIMIDNTCRPRTSKKIRADGRSPEYERKTSRAARRCNGGVRRDSRASADRGGVAVEADPLDRAVSPGRAGRRGDAHVVGQARRARGSARHRGESRGSRGQRRARVGCEMLRIHTGTEMIMVQYKGNAPALNALMGGEVDLLFDVVNIAQGQVKAGRVRAIASTNPRRGIGPFG